jgi:hypothetical protein
MPRCNHAGSRCVIGNFWLCDDPRCANADNKLVAAVQPRAAATTTPPAKRLYSWGLCLVAYEDLNYVKSRVIGSRHAVVEVRWPPDPQNEPMFRSDGWRRASGASFEPIDLTTAGLPGTRYYSVP